jgi:hypothetical protein
MPIRRTNCPHCARPQLFPNVDLAKDGVEKSKLQERHSSALAEVKTRGCEDVGERFKDCCSRSVAAFACSIQKLHREIASGTEVFETFYDLEKLRLQASSSTDEEWKKLRMQAESELFGDGDHLGKIHYASLTLDGDGLSRYGPCVVQLADSMVSHRASCFEGNTAIVYRDEHSFEAYLRAEWGDRHQMCLAVFASLLEPGMPESAFPGIVVATGGKPEEDRFIEVHIFGAMTGKTFQSIRVDVKKLKPLEAVLLKAVKDKLPDVPLEETNSG